MKTYIMFCDIDSNDFTIQDSFLMVRIHPSPGGTLVQRCINPRVNSTRRISFFVGEIASVGRAQKQAGSWHRVIPFVKVGEREEI